MAAMNPAIICSEPLDLQNVTPNPAAELCEPAGSVEPRGTGLRTPRKSKNVKLKTFKAFYSLSNQNSFGNLNAV